MLALKFNTYGTSEQAIDTIKSIRTKLSVIMHREIETSAYAISQGQKQAVGLNSSLSVEDIIEEIIIGNTNDQDASTREQGK